MRRIFCVLVAATFFGGLATTAAAQAADESRFGVGATVGFGQTWDDEGSIGKGWLAGGYADWRIFGKTDLEAAVDLLRHDRTGSPGFNAEGYTTFISASLLRRFGSDRTNGYILGGYGIAVHDGTAGFFQEGLVNEHHSTHGGLVFGGGMSFRVGDRLDMGPVIRITLLGADTDSDPASTIMTGFRIGIRK